MSITSVKRSLRALPYSEMKALAQQVRDGLNQEFPADAIADVLATLPVAADATLEDENVFLSRAFTTKRGGKSAIDLRPNGKAWDAWCGDCFATAATVRAAVSELLDQIAVREALVNTK